MLLLVSCALTSRSESVFVSKHLATVATIQRTPSDLSMMLYLVSGSRWKKTVFLFKGFLRVICENSFWHSVKMVSWCRWPDLREMPTELMMSPGPRLLVVDTSALVLGGIVSGSVLVACLRGFPAWRWCRGWVFCPPGVSSRSV